MVDRHVGKTVQSTVSNYIAQDARNETDFMIFYGWDGTSAADLKFLQR
jgi:hypothetical protein